MPFRISFLLLFSALLSFGAPRLRNVVLIGEDAGTWKEIFASVGLAVTQANDFPPSALREKLEAGSLAILEGTSPYAEAIGIDAGTKRTTTRNIVDARHPGLPIIWEKSLDLPEVTLPAGAQVFARERWTGTPVLAGIRCGKGAVLWLAAPPGQGGYARFPYLLQALVDLGLEVPVTSNRLWAFLDTAYRLRVDVEFFADRWQLMGLSALHIAAWHYNEPDVERDAWLRKLIDACHRRGLLVYAWLELPHVSEKFWDDHPEWREKTALLQDAHLDWRKLMNLRNRDCFRAVEASTRDLVRRFDWDGVNFGELYFESLEGAANPARFTPMNDEVRAEFRALTGKDPLDLFRGNPSHEEDLREYLQYRAESVFRMQTEWMGVAESLRKTKPWLDLVLTHVDDRFDTRMRELIGADAGRVLPLLNRQDFTFLVEDPATVWHLGPARYREIAKKYQPLTPRADRLAIDLNIVERYQDVYPTKQQTGTELLSLVHTAAESFSRVALYFETSLAKPDLNLLPAAAAAVSPVEQRGDDLIIRSQYGAGVRWSGPATVDGRIWPIADPTGIIWLPPGAHSVSAASQAADLRVERLNAELRNASVIDGGLQFSYVAGGRATAVLSSREITLEIDGEPAEPRWFGERTLVLPRGQHIVALRGKQTIEASARSQGVPGSQSLRTSFTPADLKP